MLQVEQSVSYLYRGGTWQSSWQAQHQCKPLPIASIKIPDTKKHIQIRSRRSKPKMCLTMTDADPSDLPRLVEIEFAAFEHEKVNQQLSYRDSSNPEHFTRTLQAYETAISKKPAPKILPQPIDSAAPTPTATNYYHFRKVIDPATHAIIAWAKTEYLQLTPFDLLTRDYGNASEPPMNRSWLDLNEKLHRAYIGTRPHLYFGMIATVPQLQHQGAGNKLMQAIVAEADELCVEVYLEATFTGKPLYEKYGFVALREIVFEPGEFETGRELGLGTERQTIMVRGALGADGRRKEPRAWEEEVAFVDAELKKLQGGIGC